MNQLRIDGLGELRAALLALPPELVDDGGGIVRAEAEAAIGEMAATYPVRAYGRLADRGNLRKGLRLTVSADRGGASAQIKNTARHAYIFEHGTGPRRWANGKSTGSMPPGRVFIPIAMRRRRAMIAALVELVRRAGLTVSGDGT